MCRTEGIECLVEFLVKEFNIRHLLFMDGERGGGEDKRMAPGTAGSIQDIPEHHECQLPALLFREDTTETGLRVDRFEWDNDRNPHVYTIMVGGVHGVREYGLR